MSEHWPVSNEGVGMPPQPLEGEHARLRAEVESLRQKLADAEGQYQHTRRWLKGATAALTAVQDENARLRKALRGFEEHFCHLSNRARAGEDFTAKEIQAHATGLLKRARAALGDQTEEAEDG